MQRRAHHDQAASKAAHPRGLKARLLHELEEYGTIFAYLYISFAAVIFYRDAVLGAQGIAYGAYGFAFFKALVLAKFMVLGHAARLGERLRGPRLFVNVLYRASLFMVMLIAFTIIEESVVALLHGRAVGEALRALADGSLREKLAYAVLLWVILLPYFVLRVIGEVLGKGELKRIFFSRAA
jgi:asparagine N-glycosylation enzyme membrane subunit Stt3